MPLSLQSHVPSSYSRVLTFGFETTPQNTAKRTKREVQDLHLVLPAKWPQEVSKGFYCWCYGDRLPACRRRSSSRSSCLETSFFIEEIKMFGAPYGPCFDNTSAMIFRVWCVETFSSMIRAARLPESKQSCLLAWHQACTSSKSQANNLGQGRERRHAELWLVANTTDKRTAHSHNSEVQVSNQSFFSAPLATRLFFTTPSRWQNPFQLPCPTRSKNSQSHLTMQLTHPKESLNCFSRGYLLGLDVSNSITRRTILSEGQENPNLIPDRHGASHRHKPKIAPLCGPASSVACGRSYI